LLDTFARKPLYIFACFIFTTVFAGYLFAGTLLVFTLLRIVHGFSFGTVSVARNTIVIDITPSSRRGEALGYYGLGNNLAMAFGVTLLSSQRCISFWKSPRISTSTY
jgi:MFS family permease